MEGVVYHAFDTTNGKAYVGQTWTGLDNRMKEHLGNKTNHPFANALRSRPETFVWTVLTKVSSQNELDSAELYWGEFFSCMVPSGYNLKLGMSRGRVSEETLHRMRVAQQNRPIEARTKLSRSMKGNNNGAKNKGGKRSEDQKKLISRRTSEAVKLWWAARKNQGNR
jgi:hypothetical protein